MLPGDLVDQLLVDVAQDLAEARLLRLVTPAAPAAGAEFSATVPAGDVWEIRSMRLTFTTSAVVANRIPQLLIDDGAVEMFRTASATVIAAGTVAQLSAFPGSVDSAPGVLRIIPFPASPPVLLVGGWRVRTSTVALDVGDAYTAPVICIKRLTMADAQQAADWLGRQVLSTEHTDLGG